MATLSNDPDRVQVYNKLVSQEAARLDAALADIRRAEAAGDLNVIEAADNRIAAMQINLDRLRLLRAEYLS